MYNFSTKLFYSLLACLVHWVVESVVCVVLTLVVCNKVVFCVSKSIHPSMYVSFYLFVCVYLCFSHCVYCVVCPITLEFFSICSLIFNWRHTLARREERVNAWHTVAYTVAVLFNNFQSPFVEINNSHSNTNTHTLFFISPIVYFTLLLLL